MSLSCGAILNLVVCRYAGKGQCELGMLRTLWNLFQPGDRERKLFSDFQLRSMKRMAL
jgi:hypothetical protein